MTEPADVLRIADLAIAPGQKCQGILTIPGMFADGQSVEIPFLVIHGKHPGKTLYLQVAQHGIEVMGLDAVRRIVLELDPEHLHGTLIYCLPNPLSFREKNRATQFDPRPGGMNRVWPGNPAGSLTERMAHKIWTELICHADAVIDLHTAARNCPVWVFYEPEGLVPSTSPEAAQRSEKMALLFGAPVLYVQADAYGDRKTLRAKCVDQGIPAIVPELGAEGFFDEEIVLIGYQGIKNIMIDLGMIDGDVLLPAKQVKLKWRADHTLFTASAKTGGVFLPQVKIGDIVKKGDQLGYLYSPRSFETVDVLRAPADGYVFSIRENPVAHQGDVLIAAPELMTWVEN